MADAHQLHSELLFHHYSADPAFTRLLNQQVFQDRRKLGSARYLHSRDSARIAKSYIPSTMDKRASNPLYSPSNEWTPIFDGTYGDYYSGLEEALLTINTINISGILENFWREPISAGLLGPGFDLRAFYGDMSLVDLIRNDPRLKGLAVELFYRNQLMECLLAQYVLPQSLPVVNFGNPWGGIFSSGFLPAGSDYQYYYAYRLQLILRELCYSSSPLVAELGPGYGSISYFLSTMLPKVNTVLFDLPIIQTIAAANLIASYEHERKVFLSYEESLAVLKNESVNPATYLAPAFCIEELPDECVDVWFNSYSLAEMSAEAIDNYLFHISRTLKRSGIFFAVNHDWNAVRSARDFPYAACGLEVLSIKPTLWNFARFGRGDEIEVICQKHT